MGSIRKRYSPEFKAKVALKAIKETLTVNEIASEEKVHPNQVGLWKKEALEHLKTAFSSKRENKEKEAQILQAELYQQIGQLKVELDWLKKKSGISHS